MPFEPGECPEDADKIRNGDFCLATLSKNVKGEIQKPKGDLQKCGEPECATFTTVQTMILKLSTQKSCDDEVGRLLDGDLVVETFAHAFDTDATHRGFHGGKFQWKSGSGLVVGELSGVTNVGLFRKPAFDSCEKCGTERIDTGRFCGEVEETGKKELEGAKVIGVYRLKYTRQSKGFMGNVSGTWEGVVVRPCRD
jgi:hypothetical protein